MAGTDIILLTGATGFLGSEIFCRLADIYPVENLWLLGRRIPADDGGLFSLRLREKNKADLFPRLKAFQLNFADAAQFQAGLESLPLGPQKKFRILHLAALIHAASGDRVKQDRMNIGVTEDLISFALKKSCQHFVYASSVVAFGGTLKRSLRSEKDFSHFPKESLHHNYFSSKRLAHEALLKESAQLPLTILCPSIVHGSLEHFKDSRAHLKSLRQGRLNLAPSGGGNFVGLDLVGQAFAKALSDPPPQKAQVETQLLVDKNLSYEDYFNLYIKSCAELLGTAPRKVRRIPLALCRLAFVIDKTLKKWQIPVPHVLAGLAQATLYLYFSSERALPRTEGVEAALKKALTTLPKSEVL